MKILVLVFAVLSFVGCGKPPAGDPIPFSSTVPVPPSVPQQKPVAPDNLHCSYSYLHEIEANKLVKVGEATRTIVYPSGGKESDAQKIIWDDALSRMTLEYASAYDTSVLRVGSEFANATKSLRLSINHFDKMNTSTPYAQTSFSATVRMGIHFWEIPVNVTISGQKYKRASLTCAFTN